MRTANASQVDIDFEKDPIGVGKDGKEVYFRDIWPSAEEIAEVCVWLCAYVPMINNAHSNFTMEFSILGCSIKRIARHVQEYLWSNYKGKYYVEWIICANVKTVPMGS